MKIFDRTFLTSFGLAALGWILAAWGICWAVEPSRMGAWLAVKWLLVLSLLCLFGLFATAKVLFYLLSLRGSEDAEASGKRIFLIIRASYWLTIKVACILFLSALLFKGSRLSGEIPSVGLLTGISTLVAVPLFGGISWYLRAKRVE